MYAAASLTRLSYTPLLHASLTRLSYTPLTRLLQACLERLVVCGLTALANARQASESAQLIDTTKSEEQSRRTSISVDVFGADVCGVGNGGGEGQLGSVREQLRRRRCCAHVYMSNREVRVGVLQTVI